MLVLIIKRENMNLVQPGKESLNDLTEEEDKLKSEIFNENNYIPRNDEEDFIRKNITFNISNIKSNNYNNISLYNNINDSILVSNIFDFFENFSYIEYKAINNNESKLRSLNTFKDDFIRENRNLNPA